MSVSQAFLKYFRDILLMLLSICCALARELLGWVGLSLGLQTDKVLRDTCADSHNQPSEKCVIPFRPDVMTNHIQPQKRNIETASLSFSQVSHPFLKWTSLTGFSWCSVIQLTPGDLFSQVQSLTHPDTVINPLWLGSSSSVSWDALAQLGVLGGKQGVWR